MVDLSIVQFELMEMGINRNTASNIIQLFYKLKFVIPGHNNALQSPRTVYNSSPHGSIISSILFNEYSIEMHDIFDAEVIVQYVDDICIYFSHNT